MDVVALTQSKTGINAVAIKTNQNDKETNVKSNFLINLVLEKAVLDRLDEHNLANVTNRLI